MQICKMSSSSKGLELPISVIVIISLAVIVMVAIGAFFLQTVGKGQSDILGKADFARACEQFRSAGCDMTKMPASLRELCARQGYVESQCLAACNCLPAAKDAPPGKITLVPEEV